MVWLMGGEHAPAPGPAVAAFHFKVFEAILQAVDDLPLRPLAVFVRVVERQGLSAAARFLGVSPSAVSQAVRALEARVGVPLLVRTTSSLRPLLAPELPGFGLARALADLDAWGYSFRLGSAQAWFEQDADDARDWLIRHGLIDAGGRLTGQRRE